MFADDSKLYKIIEGIDSHTLQKDHHLDYISNWSKVWLLKFNISKCYVMRD